MEEENNSINKNGSLNVENSAYSGSILNCETAYESLQDSIDKFLTNYIIKKAKLTKRELKIIKLRYGYKSYDNNNHNLPPMSFLSIHKEIGSDYDKIVETHDLALDKLRQVVVNEDIYWRGKHI